MRVSEDSLDCQKTESVWTSSGRGSTIGKAIRVKFAFGASGDRFVYPICILVSNLSADVMPKDDFKVVPVKGMSINGHIDPRSEEVGYLYLMQSIF